MRSRGPASPDDIDMGSVFDVLKRRVRWLLALSLMLGGLTYAALSLVAPRNQSQAEFAIVAKHASGTVASRTASSGPASLAERSVTKIDDIWKQLEAWAQPVTAQIISDAQPESVPVFLKNGALAALITLASLMFGTAWIVMAALFRAARKRSLSHVPQPQLLELVSLHSEPAPPRRSELPREIEHGETETPALLEPPPTPVSIIAEGDVIALSSRLRDRRRPDSGYRTLITGKRESIDVTEETTELVNALAHRGAEVILIDWSPSGEGMAESVGLDCSVGLNDLLRGEVNFGEIIQRLPGTSVHAIAAGKALDLSPETINSDQLNLVLDALDEAYDHIIVSSRHDEARELFGMIEGRFDTGVIVVEPCKEAPIIADPEGTFLGFEVADIDIVRFERRAWGRAAVHQRIARVTQRRSPELARRA